MSATRDRSQKFTFLFSNLYQIGKPEKGVTPPQNGEGPRTKSFSQAKPLQSNRVISAQDARALAIQSYPSIQLTRRKPPLWSERLSQEAVQSLRKNLAELNALQSKLDFLLKEIEESLTPKKSIFDPSDSEN